MLSRRPPRRRCCLSTGCDVCCNDRRDASGDGDDGFGTDAEGGFETSDDESDGTPRRHAADDQDSGGFAEFADDQEGGLHSYRALVTGRIGRDDA